MQLCVLQGIYSHLHSQGGIKMIEPCLTITLIINVNFDCNDCLLGKQQETESSELVEFLHCCYVFSISLMHLNCVTVQYCTSEGRMPWLFFSSMSENLWKGHCRHVKQAFLSKILDCSTARTPPILTLLAASGHKAIAECLSDVCIWNPPLNTE